MNTKTLCSYLGGSHLYHLNTPDSDIDERGVFMHLDPKFILGTKRFDEERKQNDEEDKVLKELSHFCSLIARSNTEAMDALFAKDLDMKFISEEFALIRKHRFQLVDSERVFNTLRGYMKGERRLMNGERPGKIGGKRYEMFKKYGYVPKNTVQLLRLAQVGITFFTEGKYVVDTREFKNDFHSTLFEIKTDPGCYSGEGVNKMVDHFEKALVQAYESRTQTFKYDEELMNKILYKIYMKVLFNHALENL
jgi:predicted nucleotidyltransferase